MFVKLINMGRKKYSVLIVGKIGSLEDLRILVRISVKIKVFSFLYSLPRMSEKKINQQIEYRTASVQISVTIITEFSTFRRKSD